jgi:hypothetical protein
MAITGLNASHIIWDEIGDIPSTTTTVAAPGIWAVNPYDNRHVASSVSYNEHKIRGKTFVVEQTYPEMTFQNLGPEAVKYEMCKMLVAELFKSDSIEFTTEKEPWSGNVKVRARIVATENSDIQILRLNNLIK